jgi:hypothetical protein
MLTETITLKLPISLAKELNSANQTFLINILERGLRDLKIEQALNQYIQSDMSFGAAAEQANVPQSILARYAYAKGIEPPFSHETLAEELGEISCQPY